MDNKLSELSKPKAFVVTGGTLYRDRALLNKSMAERYSADRNDGSEVEPLYSQEYVSALLAELEAKEKRLSELESIRADASQVFKEIGNELGCNPDNESIMMAIDALKERLAPPVRLPTEHELHQVSCSECAGNCLELVESALRAAGYKVEGDE